MKKVEYDYKKYAIIWQETRYLAKKSQEYMAHELGVTRKTVQNWENGISSPTLYQSSMWFKVLGLNPIPYYIKYMYPHSLNEKDITSEEEIKNKLHKFIDQSLEIDNRMLLFLISGEYGVNYHSLLQLVVAFCHLSLKDRHLIANLILENYEITAANNSLDCSNNVLPNIELFRHTSKKAKDALMKNKDEFSII